MPLAPPERVRLARDLPLRPDGDYVLYWMVQTRRTRWSFALEHAAALADQLKRPLLVLEGLRCDYPWASPRFHRVLLQGMADNAAACRRAGVRYLAWIGERPGDGGGLLRALAERACVVVTDEVVQPPLAGWLQRGASSVVGRVEVVDDQGLLPLVEHDRVFTTAASYRRHLQKRLPPYLDRWPTAEPLQALSGMPMAEPPAGTVARYRLDPSPAADRALDGLPLDPEVWPTAFRGGQIQAGADLKDFLARRLGRYDEDRNQVEDSAASGLSPALHFGHLSPHELVRGALDAVGWSPGRLHPTATGSREGWWNASPAVDALLDEAIVWREIGRGAARHEGEAGLRYASLPAWAQQTLQEHRADPRPKVYSREQLEDAQTEDPLWNAAQRQLKQEGRIHNYLRMLWGKKVLQWSTHPEEAWETLFALNDRWALDGRDPNSTTGIAWIFGRYDRAWGPERPIFGKVRYMTSDSTQRKLNVSSYLRRFGPSRPTRG